VRWLGEVWDFVAGFWNYTSSDEPLSNRNTGASCASIHDIQRAKLLTGKGIRLGLTTYQSSKNELTRFNLNYDGENHLVTIGKPGSGKGTTVIIPALLTYGGSCFVIDPKGQNATITTRARRAAGHKVFHLNPYGLHRERLGYSARFNPLQNLSPYSVNFVGDVGSLADALIYKTGNDPHWSDSARELVACLIMHVCTKPGETSTLPRVRQLLCLPDLRDEEETERGKKTGAKKEKSPFLELIAEMSFSAFQPLANKAAQFIESTREIKSIVSQARTQTAFLDDPVIAECLSGSDFDFADMKRGNITVFLILPAKHLQAKTRWLRLLVTSAIDALTDEPKPGDSRVLFLLDEFAQLGKLESIEKALALVRGYGVQLWPFVQDLPQLKSVYPDRWESFLATAGIVQFFTPNDNATAKYLSDKCGKKLTSRKSVTDSSASIGGSGNQGSITHSEQWEPLFNEWDLYGDKFPDSMQMMFVEGLSNVIFCGRIPYFSDSELAPRADPDPYYNR